MNKIEYLERLESCLKWKIPKSEVDDIMRDYAEYFEEGRRQSKADSEISAKLGDPEIVAEQIIEESRQQKADRDYTNTVKKERKEGKERVIDSGVKQVAGLLRGFGRAIWRGMKWIAKGILVLFGAGFGALLAGAVLLAACLVLAGLLILFFAGVTAALAGATLLVLTGFGFQFSFAVGAAFLSVSVGVAAAGVFLDCLIIYLIRHFWRFFRKCCSVGWGFVKKLGTHLFSWKFEEEEKRSGPKEEQTFEKYPNKEPGGTEPLVRDQEEMRYIVPVQGEPEGGAEQSLMTEQPELTQIEEDGEHA